VSKSCVEPIGTDDEINGNYYDAISTAISVLYSCFATTIGVVSDPIQQVLARLQEVVCLSLDHDIQTSRPRLEINKQDMQNDLLTMTCTRRAAPICADRRYAIQSCLSKAATSTTKPSIKVR
jgi:hypothetical protein